MKVIEIKVPKSPDFTQHPGRMLENIKNSDDSSQSTKNLEKKYPTRLAKINSTPIATKGFKNKIKRKYNVPDGYTVDNHGNLVAPTQNPSKKKKNATTGSPDLTSKVISDWNKDEDITEHVASQPAPTQGNYVAQQQQKASSTRKPKPIFVEANFLVTKNAIATITLVEKPLLRIIRNTESSGKTQINCQSLEDKQKVIELLRNKLIQYHTFSEPGYKTKTFVLKGYFRVEPAELLKELSDVDIPAAKVTFLRDHQDYPLYLVSFTDPNINLNMLHNMKAINSIIIRWEKLVNRRPTQCHRCQAWGHSATNCGKNYRCVKCNDSHQPGACPRKDRNVGSPKCVNCQGDHSANSTTCPAYIKHAENINLRRRPAHQTVSSTTAREASLNVAAPVAKNQSRLHQRLQNATFADVVSGSRNDNESQRESFPSPDNLSARFAAIPGIQESFIGLQNLLVQLESAKDESSRRMLMLAYVIPNNGL